MNYHFKGEEEIDSPSLVYYQDVIEENINRAIDLAGGAGRLWPHIKTHKTSALLKMQIGRGIARFKCATIAEAELCAMSGGTHVLLAYPLVGPAITRFVKLINKYKKTMFWAIGDNLQQLELLGKAASENKTPINTLVDVNLGMNRTGVLPQLLEEFYLKAVKYPGLGLKGFHCYDGHLTNKDISERRSAAFSALDSLWKIKESLEKQGFEIPVMVMGGSPTFSCHRETEGVFLSPGTFFVQDYGTFSKYKDLPFTPGAAILSRVVSHPLRSNLKAGLSDNGSETGGFFTLDTGSKAIAADPIERGVIADLPEAVSVFQSEEHWVWKLAGNLPPIGSIVYIIPGHICPTSALYPGLVAVKNGVKTDYWEVEARNRKITV